jgi:hypothetical protein
VHPAALAVRVLSDALVFDVLARLRALEDRTQECRDVRRHHLERRAAIDLVLRLAHPVRERLVDERVVQTLVEIGDRAGDVVGEKAQLLLLRLQRVADAHVVLDVVPHHECAAHAAAHLAIGEERDAHPAQLARGAALAPLVGDGRARERALDVALHLVQRIRGEEIAERMAEQVVGRNADPVGERLVGEAQAELAIEVQDGQADAVGDEAQAVLALAGLELEALQVIDVAVGREEAADMTVLVAIGVVVDAHPDRLPARQRVLPLVAGALAAERRLDVRAIELVALAPDDLDDLASEHLVDALAEPFEERLVDEAIALVAVDVRERRAERIELALRKREERAAVDRVPDRLRDGSEVQTTDRAGQGHRRELLWVLALGMTGEGAVPEDPPARRSYPTHALLPCVAAKKQGLGPPASGPRQSRPAGSRRRRLQSASPKNAGRQKGGRVPPERSRRSLRRPPSWFQRCPCRPRRPRVACLQPCSCVRRSCRSRPRPRRRGCPNRPRSGRFPSTSSCSR